jgi:biopolymer transport protein ExbB/TolQ
MALVTTAAGLIVALILVLFHRLLKNSARHKEKNLIEIMHYFTQRKIRVQGK